MTIEVGALEQSYIKEETAYNVQVRDTLAASDGVRHQELTITAQTNDEPSQERRGTPDVAQSLPRRVSQEFNLSSALWEPSGTLGTISNLGKLIEGGFGSKHVIAAGLATTVAAMPAATATTATLVSATGLQVGDVAVFTTGGGTKREPTRIKTIATLAVTFDELSAAPDAPGAMVAGVTYNLTSNITKSYAVYKYYNAGGFKEAVYGAVVNRVQMTFDGSREVTLQFQGPAAEHANSSDSPATGTVQTKPVSHTTVGEPVAGMAGGFYVDGNVFRVINVTSTLENQIVLRNSEIGTSYATAIAGRGAMRPVNLTLTFFLEDLRLMAMSKKRQHGAIRLLIGDTTGKLIAVVMPSVKFEIPPIGGGYGPKEVTINGMGYAVNGNDAIFAAEC
jgi:hypothetical protein